MEGDEDEIGTGTEGEITEGQDPAGGEQEADLSAEQPDIQADDGNEEVAEEPVAKPTRGEARIQRLANETRAEKARADRLEQELREARQAQWQRQQAASEEERQARRALMTPEERVADDMAALRREFAATRQQDQMSTAAMMDKAAFDAKAATKPVYAKYASEVEERFQDQLRQGRPVEREIILKVLLGERALSGASDQKARRKAQGRVESQRVPAGSGKGDSPTARGKAGDTAENRLKGVII
jgi:hypothetical protein